MRRVPLVLLLVGSLSGCGDSAERTGEVSEANTSVCPTMTVEGVDVSAGQGTINWAQVAASGRDFAIMKATQGDYNTQSTFNANWTNSKAAGLLRSPYHFFDPTIDGVKQAQHFLAVLNAAGGLKAGDLPPMLDIECPTSSSQSAASANCEYTGNSGWAPTATLVTRVFDWLATVEQATGRKALIYSYPSWFAAVGLTDARLAQYPLYIATLSNCASVPPPWTTTVFWQYSFTGTVPGITGQVDLDRFVGTKAQLIAFANPPLPDGGTDAAVGDAASADAAGSDGGGTVDAGGQGDGAGGGDTGTLDGSDGAGGSSPSGCSCRAGGRAPMTPSSVGVVLALVAGLARRAARAREARDRATGSDRDARRTSRSDRRASSPEA